MNDLINICAGVQTLRSEEIICKEEANRSTLDDIAKRLFPLEREVERLDYYLKLLEDRQREVIYSCFFERLSLQEMADKMALSVWSVRKLKAEALENLTYMYNYAQGGDEP